MFLKFFNKHKTALIAVTSVVVVIYGLFLILPYVVNLNNYKKDLQKIVLDSAKLNFDFSEMKIVTTPSLKAGLRLKGLELSYPNGGKIASLSKAEVKIALLPLILKTVQVSDVTLENPELSLVYTKDGQIDIVKYVTENMAQEQVTTDSAQAEMPVKISDKLPDVVLKNYKLTLKDEKTANSISVNGEKFVFDKAVMNKHLRVATNGKILLNDLENVNYDVRLASFWPAMETTAAQSQPTAVPSIDFINEIVKFSPKADIFADLKITEKSGDIDVNGKAEVQKLSIILDGQRLPDGNALLSAKGANTVFNSQLFVSQDEKAQIAADFTTGKNTKIDLNVKTEKISFSSLQKFAVAFLTSLNIENDINSILAKGYISADFGLKTNLKDFKSDGFLKVVDGSLAHKSIPVSINNIAADIDFANNAINIKKAAAFVNGTEIAANGMIDSSANADLGVKSGKINIAALFNAFAPADLKKAYALKSGIVALNVIVKGKLAEIEPDINITLDNFVLNDRANTFSLKNKSSLVKIKTKGTSFAGDVDLNESSFTLYNPKTVLKVPSIKLNITPEKLEIVPFTATMNNSKINVSGYVKDYMKKMDVNVLAEGNISAIDLKNLLPAEVKSFVGAKGVIPIKATITGNDKKLNISAQALSGANSYFAPVTIKKMFGKNGLLNLELVYADDNLTIEDASLYLASKSALSKDFAANKKGSLKIAGLGGNVSSLTSSHPTVKINFSIPEQLVISNVSLPNAQLNAKGEITVYGFLTNPSFNGFLNVKDVNIPEFLTKIQEADIELNDKTISAKVQKLDLGGTAMNIDAVASTVFTNVFIVKSLKLTSLDFDADKLFKATDKMMAAIPASPAPASNGKSSSPVVPVKLSNGSIDIQKFKMKQIGGDFVASAITGDFVIVNDLFTLNNLKTNVYGGTVKGKVTYNLANTAVTADVNGKGIDANPIITVFAALKNQVMGNVDFGANISLKGATYEQQMKTLNGKVNFSMKDGQLGSLGRFETFLNADNLLSHSFIATKIGSLVNTVAPYNTGKFSYLTGDIKLVNGVAKLSPVKMSGPHMSLLITGDVNVLSMQSSLDVSGYISSAVSTALGPITDLSVEKFAAYIPKFGAKIASALTTFNEAANKTELVKIPALTGVADNAKAFKVVLKGNMNNPVSIVKRFQWLNSPEKIQKEKEALTKSVSEVASSTSSTPITKENFKETAKDAVKNQVQNALQSSEKVQELKKNKTVQTVDSILKFYKNTPSTQNQNVSE